MCVYVEIQCFTLNLLTFGVEMYEQASNTYRLWDEQNKIIQHWIINTVLLMCDYQLVQNISFDYTGCFSTVAGEMEYT